jgi:hypothetical protein
MKLQVKYRYLHTDPATGQRVETRHRMTPEAAAASEMIDAEPVEASREQRYVPDNPNAHQFGPNFATAARR